MTSGAWLEKKGSNNFLILLSPSFCFNAPPRSKTSPGVVIYLQPKPISHYCCAVHSETERGCLSNGIQTNSLLLYVSSECEGTLFCSLMCNAIHPPSSNYYLLLFVLMNIRKNGYVFPSNVMLLFELAERHFWSERRFSVIQVRQPSPDQEVDRNLPCDAATGSNPSCVNCTSLQEEKRQEVLWQSQRHVVAFHWWEVSCSYPVKPAHHSSWKS